MFINYIRRIFPEANIDYFVRDNKIHGYSSEEVEDDVDLVIVLDAGTNELEEAIKLTERGIDVVIGEHHQVSSFEEFNRNPAIIVNNQVGDYPNKDLSGVGVTYKICQAIDEKLGVSYADDYLDLTALGIIADSMDLNNLENRYIIDRGLKNIRNPFMKALIEKNEYTLKGVVDIKACGWTLSPSINSVIRIGKHEEKINMFKALLEKEASEITIPYKKRGEEEFIDNPIAVEMARVCGNVRNRQNKMRDKLLSQISERIEEKKLYENKVLIVNANEYLSDSGLTGIIAMQVASKYNKPTLILRQEETEDKLYFTGSGRNVDNSPLEDFRSFVENTGKFEFARGHLEAFGIKADANNLVEANQIMNERLKDFDFTPKFEVDFAFTDRPIDGGVVSSIGSYKSIWGKGCDEPKVYVEIKNKKVSELYLNGEKKNTLKFIHNNIDFVKFKDENVLNGIEDLDEVDIKLIGTCDINEWNGNIKPQIQIKSIKFEKSKDKDLFASF